jgi:hypothetical protein
LDESKTKYCETDDTINEFVKHTSVETWVVNEKIDFDLYEDMPTKYEMFFKQ